jgi:hypothetical protein
LVELREAAERRKAPASKGSSEESEVCREVRRLNEVLGKHLASVDIPSGGAPRFHPAERVGDASALLFPGRPGARGSVASSRRDSKESFANFRASPRGSRVVDLMSLSAADATDLSASVSALGLPT